MEDVKKLVDRYDELFAYRQRLFRELKKNYFELREIKTKLSKIEEKYNVNNR